jgi:hypothetical protein
MPFRSIGFSLCLATAVIRVILPPHTKVPLHEHPHYAVVYITELHLTKKLADGRLVDNPHKPREIVWNEASKYQSEQMGDNTAIEVLVEFK